MSGSSNEVIISINCLVWQFILHLFPWILSYSPSRFDYFTDYRPYNLAHRSVFPKKFIFRWFFISNLGPAFFAILSSAKPSWHKPRNAWTNDIILHSGPCIHFTKAINTLLGHHSRAEFRRYVTLLHMSCQTAPHIPRVLLGLDSATLHQTILWQLASHPWRRPRRSAMVPCSSCLAFLRSSIGFSKKFSRNLLIQQ